MKIKYREIHLSKKNLLKLDRINSIIDEYAADGYVLTLRQLYYQLVSRDIIPNNVREYSKLSILLKEGRMAGIVDWDAIEDRLRVPRIPYWVTNVPDALNDTANQYRLDRQKNQGNYIEVWVEKDALSGVLSRITNEYHIRLMVNRGYSSVSAMHDAYKRFNRALDRGQDVTVLYLGDHDPSGLDMIRDIKERIEEFIGFPEPAFDVKAIALTMEQIKEHNPPPNPAKLSDTRASKYVEKYGKVSWEVDALNPKTLNRLLTSEIEALIDMDLYKSQIAQEGIDKDKIVKLAENFE